jgi:glycosyltransferase involved in cell wall biosynthesis
LEPAHSEERIVDVLIDGRPIADGRHGIARYTLALLRRLPEVAPDVRATVVCAADTEKLVASFGHRTIVTRSGFTSPEGPLVLSVIQRRERPDVTFCPSFAAPIVPRRPLVMTLHDATHLLFPSDYGRGVRAYYRLVTLPAARAARTVITVSDFSRRSLEAAAGLGRLTVIPNGVDLDVFTFAGRRDQRLGPRSILYVGGYKPHKRVELLVDALPRLTAATLALVGDVPPALLRRARALEVLDQIALLGPLDEAALAAAYRGATVFCYPSLNEGFGLSPLEAMACGTPVVCADSSSLPEVIGDAGVLFSGEVAELAAALSALLDDGPRRNLLRDRGQTRARAFDWRSTTERTADVLRTAAT